MTSAVWIVPAWAQWIAYLAVLATLIGMHVREQRRPGAQLRTYLEAVRRVGQPRSRRRRAIKAVAAAMLLLYAVIVLAHSVIHRPAP